MKNKRIIISDSSGKKNMPNQQIETAELNLKQLADAGYSKKVADNIWKLYKN